MAAECTSEEVASLYTTEDSNNSATAYAPSELLNNLGNVLNILVAGLIDLFGLVGNLLLLTVMCRRRKRLTNMLVILLGLAVADLLLLALHLCFQVVPHLHLVFPNATDISDFFAPLKVAVWPLSMTAHSAGILLTVFICAERWCAVCRPLKTRSSLSVGRTKRSVVAIFLFCLALNTPRFFEYKRCLLAEESQTNESQSAVNASDWLAGYSSTTTQYFAVEVKTAMGLSFFYTTVYTMVLYGLSIYVMPICVLTVMTTHMLVQLERYRRFWETLSKAQQREHSITALPICIVAIFVVCETPAMVINCVDAYRIPVNRTSLRFALACSGFLVVFKCALNILAYSVYSGMLRRELTNLVTTKKHQSALNVSIAGRFHDRIDSVSVRSNPMPLSTVEVPL